MGAGTIDQGAGHRGRPRVGSGFEPTAAAAKDERDIVSPPAYGGFSGPRIISALQFARSVQNAEDRLQHDGSRGT